MRVTLSSRQVRPRHAGRRRAAGALLLFLLGGLAWPGRSLGGVRFGDAVPGVIKGADLERIKRQLGLEHFSVVAAVWLGAEEGREAVIIEALGEKSLALVKDSCGRGGFCPDRLGFVGARVRIVLLQNNDVVPLLLAEDEIRGSRGRLVDLSGARGRNRLVGWSGWAEAAAGHVAMVLTPLAETPVGRLAAAPEEALRVRWNEAVGRFQIFRCRADDGGEGGPECVFEDEIGG